MNFKNNKLSIQLFFALLFSVCFTESAFAEGAAVSIGTMFANGNNLWVEGMQLARGFSFIAGLVISGAALFKLREVGDGRTQLKTPLIWAVAGAFLLALPGTIETATQTLSLGSNSAYKLLSNSHTTTGNQQVEAAFSGVLLFIKLVGHIAFVRGLFLLKEYGSGKEGTLGRALTMIFGGAACINIETTFGILANTFYPGLSFTGFSA